MEPKSLIIRTKALKGEDGYRIISVRTREETLSQLERVSAKCGYSRNALINLFLEFALEHCIVEE